MQFSISTVAACPVQVAFDLMSNFENDHEWWTGVLQTTRISSTAQGVGTRYRQRNKLMGFRFDIELEVTEWEPPRLVGFRNATGLVHFEGRYRFEPVPEGTRVTMEGTTVPRGPLRLLSPLFRWHLDRVTRRYFANLKRVLDERGRAVRGEADPIQG